MCIISAIRTRVCFVCAYGTSTTHHGRKSQHSPRILFRFDLDRKSLCPALRYLGSAHSGLCSSGAIYHLWDCARNMILLGVFLLITNYWRWSQEQKWALAHRWVECAGFSPATHEVDPRHRAAWEGVVTSGHQATRPSGPMRFLPLNTCSQEGL